MTVVPSYIAGRNALKISNLKQYKNQASTSLNSIDGSFTYNFSTIHTSLIEPIACKGHPTDPNQGTFYIKNDQGYLKIVLHEQNGINSLVYYSDTAILRTNKGKLKSVVFDEVNKTLKLYLDAIEIPITIDTSQPHHRTNISQFTGLKQTNSDISYGYEITGVDGIGTYTMYYNNLEKKIMTQSEIQVIYDTVKDNTVLSTQKIIHGSKRISAEYNEWVSNELGYDKMLLKSSSQIMKSLKQNSDNTKIITARGNNSIDIYDKNGGNLTTYIRPQSTVDCATLSRDKAVIIYSYTTGSTSVIMGYVISNNTQFTLMSPNQERSQPDQKPDEDKFIFVYNQIGFPSAIYVCNFNPSTFSLTNITTLYTGVFNLTNIADNIRQPKYNQAGTKIGFSNKFVNSSSKYNVGIMDSNGGNFQQLTFNSEDTFFHCFSPDGTKILYSKYNTTQAKYKLYTQDLNTNEIILLSDNNDDDRFGTWFAS
jgi:hypothetical protein